MGKLKEYASQLTWRQRQAISRGDHSITKLSAQELVLKARQFKQSMVQPCKGERTTVNALHKESLDVETTMTDEENEQHLQYLQYVEEEKENNRLL